VVVAESMPLEYWLATTDPLDLKMMERTRNESPKLSELELLEKMAALLPKGASPA